MTRDYRFQAQIEDALRQLAGAIDTPPAPDYADRVVQQLGAGTGAHARARRFLSGRGTRRLLLAAAVLLLTAGVLAAVPATRHAFASWFGFSGITIHSVPGGSPVPPPTTPAPLAAGSQVTLAEAQRAAGNRITQPQQLPAPARVYLRRDGAAVVVTLAYLTVPSLKPTPETGYALIVTEIFDAGDPVLEKILHMGATAEPVRVGTNDGVFVHGPQEIINIDHTRTSYGSDVVHEVEPRASANTLIWNDHVATYRIEGAFTLDLAVSLAGTFA
jgi:hypothetical protein